MEISSLAPTPPTPASQTPQGNSVLSSDFETFLRMLTAQARYQDPLEPLDSSEYAAQLAQFSMVEQQVLSNDLLTALSAKLGSGQLADLAGWIGMEARSAAPVSFQGSPVSLNLPAAAGADTAALLVLRPDGSIAQRLDVPLGGGPMLWAGVADGGNPLPPGIYRFELEKRVAGEVVGVSKVESFARITEVRQEGQEALLVLQGGSTVTSGEVTALRAPESSAI